MKAASGNTDHRACAEQIEPGSSAHDGCHMVVAPGTLIIDGATLQPRAHGMERSELECQLERLHAESWGWALACCARDREVAEDALQTAYLRVLSGKARFDGHSSFKVWLFGVIRLTSKEELRRGRAWDARRAGTDVKPEVTDPSPGADVNIELSERSSSLVDAMARVSPKQREVLQLVFYHDMTIEEAAGVMKVSLGSARTHYERGKKALAQRLAREDAR